MNEQNISIQYFFQNDPQWENEALGLQSDETIGSWGGLLTSLAMVVNRAGYSETPARLNDKLKAHAGFLGALALPAVLPLIYPNLIYMGFESCVDQEAPLDRLDDALDTGRPVIAQVDWNPKAGVNTHWVVIKERYENDYLIIDPFRYRGDKAGDEIILTQRYKYRGENPAQAITGLLWFDIHESQEQAEKVEDQDLLEQDDDDHSADMELPEFIDGEDFLVLVPTVDGLTFRSAPKISLENQIRKLSAQDRLTALEPLAQVIEKVGIQGQWIQVRDQDGKQGYVAAWYVRIPRRSD